MIFLAGPLHQVGLDKLQAVGETERAEVDERDLRDAGRGVRAEMPCEPRELVACGVVRRHVAVDGDLGQVGAEDVRTGLDQDGDKRDRGLPLVGAQIAEQPAHQAPVICLADDVLCALRFGLCRLLLRLRLLCVLWHGVCFHSTIFGPGGRAGSGGERELA